MSEQISQHRLSVVTAEDYARFEDQGLLHIEPFFQEAYVDTYYNFHIGAQAAGGEVIPAPEELIVAPKRLLQVWSLESFRLGSTVYGELGAASQIHTRGLWLLHSPTIDPGFGSVSGVAPGGLLRVSVYNCSEEPVVLSRYEPIGKVMFFEMGGPREEVTGVTKPEDRARWNERERAAEQMERAIAEYREAARRTFPNEPHLASPEGVPYKDLENRIDEGD